MLGISSIVDFGRAESHPQFEYITFPPTGYVFTQNPDQP